MNSNSTNVRSIVYRISFLFIYFSLDVFVGICRDSVTLVAPIQQIHCLYFYAYGLRYAYYKKINTLKDFDSYCSFSSEVLVSNMNVNVLRPDEFNVIFDDLIQLKTCVSKMR